MGNVYSLKEAAERVKVHEDTLLKQIKLGKLIARQIGRSYRITEENLRIYLNGSSNVKQGARS